MHMRERTRRQKALAAAHRASRAKRAPSPTTVPPARDRRLQRRFVRMLVRTAVAAELCDVPTALLLAAHARDASSALILLTGIAEWFGRRRRGRGTDFELALDAAERLGIFARRQTWDRFRLDCPLGRGGRKHPSVRWGRGKLATAGRAARTRTCP